MLNIYLHDATPAKPGERHGHRGPTHCGTIPAVDYPYQVEQWVIDVGADYPHVVMVECPELGRTWRRNSSGEMVEHAAVSAGEAQS